MTYVKDIASGLAYPGARESTDQDHAAQAKAKMKPKSKPRKSESLVLIDSRTLDRECFVRSIELSHVSASIAGFSSVQAWLNSPHVGAEPTAILFNIGARAVSDPTVGADLTTLVEQARPTPVIVLAESEELKDMISAVDRGARGYIPASIGFDIIMEATRLTSNGGMYLPAASLVSLRAAISPKHDEVSPLDHQFTERQTAVAEALRRGKPNKIIAHELSMSESTVKVHIRNIMKKLNATNRTQAAFKLNALSDSETSERV
jgi:DNA-binding NarL/FixJ family response regulator